MVLTRQNLISFLLTIPSVLLFGPAGILLVALQRFLSEGLIYAYKALAIRAIRKRVWA
ncbi:MAG: hypothetical protein H6581_23360 [Bacteroidia bacterium]|nr:hypothetical protein [Bacteroidia bacterium]